MLACVRISDEIYRAKHSLVIGNKIPYNYIDAIVGQKVAVFLFFRHKKLLTSIAKVNSGRSIPKAEVTLANSQAEVTLANFYISVLFHAIV